MELKRRSTMISDTKALDTMRQLELEVALPKEKQLTQREVDESIERAIEKSRGLLLDPNPETKDVTSPPVADSPREVPVHSGKPPPFAPTDHVSDKFGSVPVESQLVPEELLASSGLTANPRALAFLALHGRLPNWPVGSTGVVKG